MKSRCAVLQENHHLESLPPGQDRAKSTYLSEHDAGVLIPCTYKYIHSCTCMYKYMNIYKSMYYLPARWWINIFVWYIHVHDCIYMYGRSTDTSVQLHNQTSFSIRPDQPAILSSFTPTDQPPSCHQSPQLTNHPGAACHIQTTTAAQPRVHLTRIAATLAIRCCSVTAAHWEGRSLVLAVLVRNCRVELPARNKRMTLPTMQEAGATYRQGVGIDPNHTQAGLFTTVPLPCNTRPAMRFWHFLGGGSGQIGRSCVVGGLGRRLLLLRVACCFSYQLIKRRATTRGPLINNQCVFEVFGLGRPPAQDINWTSS